MKPFRFRAEPILAWRRRLADDARVAVVRANESVRAAMRSVADAEARSLHAADDFRRAIAAYTDIETIVRHRNWIDRERAHVAASRVQRDQRQREADVAVAALQRAMRHVRVLEKLRDRAWRRHQDAERRQDVKAIDELAAQRFARRQPRAGQEAGGRISGS
jgi:flagellar export protein FliJ